MVDLEIYAAGLRQPDKMLGLTSELDIISDLRYKVDTNHDIVYMEFSGSMPPTLFEVESIFRKAGLVAKFVGHLPPGVNPHKKTQKIT